MKKLNVLVAGMVALGVLSCSGDDSPSTTNANGNITEVTNVVKSGTWRIASFVEDGNTHTQHFEGYTFTFGANNVLTATGGVAIYTGTWSVTKDNSSDDDNSTSDIDFNIGFLSPETFADLSDDWDILEKTSTRIKLVDISGGNGGTDYLTFEKN
ncbi:hypothetical protein [Flavobacterium cerinum]|nr:hypothetical protein [Flavobacterium cerinum]